MRNWKHVLAFALAVGAAPMVSATVHADEKGEKVIKLDDVPAAARQTILREAGGAPIVRVEEEHAKGKVLYEGIVKKGDDLIGITVDANGKLVNKHSEKDEKGEKK